MVPKKEDEEKPRSILTQIVEWLIVLAVIGYIISIISSILLCHWKLILIVMLITGGILALIIYKRRRDRWY